MAAFCLTQQQQPFVKIALVPVRLGHVASGSVNTNHGIV